jgi:predicted site-specific integrase-resolvase
VRSSDAGDITSKPMLIGYARVSTADQNLALQRDALTEAGCQKMFTEQMSGAVTDRPGHETPHDRALRIIRLMWSTA